MEIPPVDFEKKWPGTSSHGATRVFAGWRGKWSLPRSIILFCCCSMELLILGRRSMCGTRLVWPG